MSRTRAPMRDDEVVRASGDPTDAVRAELARLSARARQLGTTSDATALDATTVDGAYEPHVLRNARGLYEASARLDEDARQQLLRGQGGDAGRASIELFMAKKLGVDVEEQQRLLRQLEQRQRLFAADLTLGPRDSGDITGVVTPGSVPTTAMGTSVSATASSLNPAGFASGVDDIGVTEVDQLVGRLGRDIVAQSRAVLHQQQAQLLREREARLFRAAWEPYFVQLEGDFTSRLVRSIEGDVLTGPEAPLRHGELNGEGSLTRLNCNVASGWSPETRARATLFALYVDRYPAAQWLVLFTTLAQEQHPYSDLAMLWQSVEQLLDPVLRQGSTRDAMTYVASSRHVLETKAGLRLVTNILHIRPTSVANAAGELDARRILDAIVQAGGSASSWLHVFHAMRVGRYDVAVLAAQGIGSASLTSVLQCYAQLTPQQRQRQPAAMSLLALYKESQTCTDPYRRAVLFILLAGQTMEGDEVTQRVLLELCGAVVTSLEDALWLRLCCVRHIHEGRQDGTSVQSLAHLQKVIKDDLQAVVMVARGDVLRLASILTHACLPSSALRLLIDDYRTQVDGIHIALCFRVCSGTLLEDIAAAYDTPLDLGRELVRYASALMLETEKGKYSVNAEPPPSTFFHYFDKTDYIDAFVQWCQTESVCRRLFGQDSDWQCGSGACIENCHPQSHTPVVIPLLPERLLRTISRIAEVAAERQDNVPLAISLLLALARLAGGVSKPMVQHDALRRAMQLINPSLVQIFYLPQLNTLGTRLLALAEELNQALTAANSVAQSTSDEMLSGMDAENFALLCALARIYIAKMQGDNIRAVQLLFQLPFIPNNMIDIDTSIERVHNISTMVKTATAAIIPHILQAAAKQIEYQQADTNQATYRGGITTTNEYLKEKLAILIQYARRASIDTTTIPQISNDDLLAFEKQYIK